MFILLIQDKLITSGLLWATPRNTLYVYLNLADNTEVAFNKYIRAKYEQVTIYY